MPFHLLALYEPIVQKRDPKVTTPLVCGFSIMDKVVLVWWWESARAFKLARDNIKAYSDLCLVGTGDIVNLSLTL